jgi:hypothetical protein
MQLSLRKIPNSGWFYHPERLPKFQKQARSLCKRTIPFPALIIIISFLNQFVQPDNLGAARPLVWIRTL